MINKVSTIAIAAVALSTVLGSTAVQAQESCTEMYNHMMRIYQADPYSPAYAQMLPNYNSNCASGAVYSPQAQPYPEPAYSEYQQSVPYNYGPAPIDPAAAIVGAAIVGAGIAADSDYHRRDGWRDRDGWGDRGGWRR
ncbi:MAG TPA: hypothetical protein VFW56_06715 [Bradyrhizobium sp.]|jgi:hypothetical protein|nr:hypothetical protein [Bradyrhizobium sp.]